MFVTSVSVILKAFLIALNCLCIVIFEHIFRIFLHPVWILLNICHIDVSFGVIVIKQGLWKSFFIVLYDVLELDDTHLLNVCFWIKDVLWDLIIILLSSIVIISKHLVQKIYHIPNIKYLKQTWNNSSNWCGMWVSSSMEVYFEMVAEHVLVPGCLTPFLWVA